MAITDELLGRIWQEVRANITSRDIHARARLGYRLEAAKREGLFDSYEIVDYNDYRQTFNVRIEDDLWIANIYHTGPSLVSKPALGIPPKPKFNHPKIHPDPPMNPLGRFAKMTKEEFNGTSNSRQRTQVQFTPGTQGETSQRWVSEMLSWISERD